MQILTELNCNPNLSLALGYFDGVHLGHKSVIKSAVDYAKHHENKSAVITFKEHPCCYLWGVKPKYILTKAERQKKLEQLGVDYLYELDFEKIYKLTGEEYLKEIIIDNFKPASISTGWNHNFGYNKSGDTKLLTTFAKKYGYKYFELEPQKINNEIVSSTKIRELLEIGNIKLANKMLDFDFRVSGTIVAGNKIGRTIGFRTANINYPSEIIEIPYGVYSVETNYGKGIANFGVRPTINGATPVLEVHILDFEEDIYGKILNVSFKYMIRKEQKFNSLDELKMQIAADISSI